MNKEPTYMESLQMFNQQQFQQRSIQWRFTLNCIVYSIVTRPELWKWLIWKKRELCNKSSSVTFSQWMCVCEREWVCVYISSLLTLLEPWSRFNGPIVNDPVSLFKRTISAWESISDRTTTTDAGVLDSIVRLLSKTMHSMFLTKK